MVISMRYLIVIFLIFPFSVFAADPPRPVCINENQLDGCGFPASMAGGILSERINSCTSNKGYAVYKGQCPSDSRDPNGSVYTCSQSCSCAPGFRLNTIINQNGNKITGCVPDVPTPGEGDCPPPKVEYKGLCREGVPKPEDCQDKPTAVFVGGVYMCTDDENCGDGTTPTILTTAQGSWKVCGGGGSASSSGGGNSSSPAQSSASNTSDTNTSSGSGGGSGGENGSGNNTSGGATSSVSSGGGGGGIPITQSSSSTSSGAHGAASSGSGAGNCDPTAHDYLACISRENPGEGDGGSGFYEPSGGKGSFDGEAAAERKQELEQEIKNQVNAIKDEITQHMGGEIRGSGGLSDKCITVFQKQVCFGLTKWQSQLAVIGNAIFFLACVGAFSIVLRG